MGRRLAVACVCTLIAPMLLANGFQMGTGSIAPLYPIGVMSSGSGKNVRKLHRPGDRAGYHKSNVQTVTVKDRRIFAQAAPSRLYVGNPDLQQERTIARSISVPPD